MQLRREWPRQHPRLIEAALAPAGGVQRDGDDEVGGESLSAERCGEQVGERQGDTALAAKLEREDSLAYCPLVDCGCPKTIQVRNLMGGRAEGAQPVRVRGERGRERAPTAATQ